MQAGALAPGINLQPLRAQARRNAASAQQSGQQAALGAAETRAVTERSRRRAGHRVLPPVPAVANLVPHKQEAVAGHRLCIGPPSRQFAGLAHHLRMIGVNVSAAFQKRVHTLCPLCFPSPCTWGRTLSPCLKKSTCANDSIHPCAPRNPSLLSTILSTSHLIVDFATILTSGPNRRRPLPQNKIYRNIVTIRSLIFTFSCWHGHCLREGTRRKHSPLTNADNGPEQSGNHTLI